MSHIVLLLIGQVFASAIVWAGIRADVRHMLERIKANEAGIQAAHERIDGVLSLHSTGEHPPFRDTPRRR